MQINKVNSYTSFKRAFTTEEKKSFQRLMTDARKVLEIQDTSAIIFDFTLPSEKGKNTGIGSLWSDNALKTADFLKTYAGITSVQTGPEGRITRNIVSPYSGTNYTLGEHIIDLSQLTKSEYGRLLDNNEIRNASLRQSSVIAKKEIRTDYNRILGDGKHEGIQDKFLKRAFVRFLDKLVTSDTDVKRLNSEFLIFKENENDKLEKEFLFDTLRRTYGTDDTKKWDEKDRFLYSSSTREEDRKARINDINEKNELRREFFMFKQFLADKQLKTARKNLNDRGLKLYGDCLVGFSKSEVWSNPDCFRENYYYGGPDPACPETNNIQTWNLTAPDYSKIGKCDKIGDLSELGQAGKLFYDKYETFFKRYDGVRLDAAWQFITPFIYTKSEGEYVPAVHDEKTDAIFNIMLSAAKNVYKDAFNEKHPQNLMLELVGLSAGESQRLTKNKYPHLYTTAYSEFGEYPANFNRKMYRSDMFYTGVGNHDNASLIEQAKNPEKRTAQEACLKKDYHIDSRALVYSCDNYKKQSEEEKELENFRNAKLSEIFTSSKQFITLPDIFGMEERINLSGKKTDENWTIRIPTNYERYYHSRLSKGYGLNLPKIYANAMIMKNLKNLSLVNKCLEAAEILRSDGPLTTKEADNAKKNGLIEHEFSYTA